ncbi:MAG: 3-hydroxybutyryl-CoA dehydrogenase [Flavobacteriales bacterium]|nr:3-hydroxybutyryl-CoA dehydrogenase [Flavobacteriales bacterium]MCB9449285.1 3-hydroxybutyryl-CoA dehydrogenase [Flavobacteriales bacterium]
MPVGVIGAGTMGSGIAQVAATYGHPTILYDTQPEALKKARESLDKILQRLAEKGKISSDEAAAISGRITYASDLSAFRSCGMVIEAIVEKLEVKQTVFAELEQHTGERCILATNTSSLSITSIAGGCTHPERVIGVHFFNPAPLMPLVEIIPALQTGTDVVTFTRQLIEGWKKTTVLAKDTPGFIVNRIARPFYGESIRIYEEGLADFVTIDHALKEVGGFRMGPFELMDLIGNDVNFAVTETVFREFFFDPRYRPSFTQKRLVEARRFGRKSGHGYYDYREGASMPQPAQDPELAKTIFYRVVAMLINEATDALFLNIASAEDIDLAMTRGVNYPKGLLRWADELGAENVLNVLEDLFNMYGEDRYRPSPLLRVMAQQQKNFFE